MSFGELETIAGVRMLLPVKDAGKGALPWALEHREEVDRYLSMNGALLVRGLPLTGADDFGQLLTCLFGQDLAGYVYRSTPRTELHHHVYSATEYPASESIPQHNENAYSNCWPMRIGFFCLVKAARMGNTPISDSRRVYELIPSEIREEFEQRKIMYVRNYGDVDLPWTEVFQTNDKAEVEAYCRSNRLAFEWTESGLRTKQVNAATAIHPHTGEKVWFNQAHLFHVSSLSAELQEGLLEMIGEENIPRNTFFGDGAPIDAAVLDVIRRVYDEATIRFEWLTGDLLLLDNMLYAHGREPYEGARKILVGMARNAS